MAGGLIGVVGGGIGGALVGYQLGNRLANRLFMPRSVQRVYKVADQLERDELTKRL